MPKVKIKGPIISNDEQWIYDLFDIEATSPTKVEREINDCNGQSLEVEINSGGGSIFAGSEIYTMLKSYKGDVTITIVGLAASAASVIAMAGNKVLMSPTSQMMIHNVSGRIGGDYRDMDHMGEMLKNSNKTIASAYRIKSGMSEEELLAMMDKETWLTPEQALENKFIDEVMFSNELKLTACLSTPLLPEEVINKIRNMKETFNPTNSKSDIFMQQKANAKLKLLKLRGECENE